MHRVDICSFYHATDFDMCMCVACLQYFQVIHMFTFLVLRLSVWSVGMN